MPSAIEFRDLEVRTAQGRLLHDRISLALDSGTVTAILGRSGSGKTTLLRTVNRMAETTAGTVLVHGRDIRQADVIALRRGLGYVIQETGLFPHFSVERNVGLVLEAEGRPREERSRRCRELLAAVGLDPQIYSPRYPHQLSGGQRQRVGLARALAADPPILLMDEPFGALDPITRTRLQDELARLHREVAKTVVFVTHDIDEAIRMGERIAILREGGVLAQYDSPDAILARPADEFVARFVGEDRALRRLALVRCGAVSLDP